LAPGANVETRAGKEDDIETRVSARDDVKKRMNLVIQRAGFEAAQR
jgi:hypothetical protein